MILAFKNVGTTDANHRVSTSIKDVWDDLIHFLTVLIKAKAITTLINVNADEIHIGACEVTSTFDRPENNLAYISR